MNEWGACSYTECLLQQIVNLVICVSVGVSLSKKGNQLSAGSRCRFGGNRRCWEVCRGFIRGEPLTVSLSLLSPLFRCGVRSPESQARARTSPGKFIKPYLHLWCQSHRYLNWTKTEQRWTVVIRPTEGQYTTLPYEYQNTVVVLKWVPPDDSSDSELHIIVHSAL